jgi:hypothetical protein
MKWPTKTKLVREAVVGEVYEYYLLGEHIVFDIHGENMQASRQQIALSQTGLRLGLKLGFQLSLTYCILLSLAVMGLMGIFGILYAIIIGFIIGVLPALIIGVFTGWLIGKIMERFHGRLSRRAALLLGLLTCIGIAVLVALVFALPLSAADVTNDPSWRIYFALLIIPSIIYICTGGYIGVHLHDVGCMVNG